MKTIAVVGFVALLAACNNAGTVKQDMKQAMAKAYIFERKMLPGNKLLVSFIYKNGDKTVKDSSIIENSIISQDSVPVTLLANNGR